MANENDQAADHGQELEQAKDQVQFLLEQLAGLGNSSIQVRVDGGTAHENQTAEQFVEGCLVLIRRFGVTLIQAAEDSAVLDYLEQQLGDENNPNVDLVVPSEVIETTKAADQSVPLRLLMANFAAWQEATAQSAQ